MSLQDISNSIRIIPNFPNEGSYFRDISTLLIKPKLRKLAIKMLADLVRNEKIDVIAGIESRGFIFGQGLADLLDLPFVMLRKPNKMPEVIEEKYDLKESDDNVTATKAKTVVTITKTLIPKGSHVLIVDDLIDTGGSLLASCQVIEKIGCHVAGCICLIELVGIEKKEELKNYKLFTLIKYPAHSSDRFISKEDKLLHKTIIKYLPIDNVSKDDNRIVVFCYPSMKSLANSIISYSKYFREGSIKWEYFADNYPHITYENLKYLMNKRIVFFGSLYDRSSFSEQLSILSTLPSQTVKSLDIFIPYFAPGENGKSTNFVGGETLATAEAYAKMITNNLFLTQDGLPRIHIFDIKSPETKSWFGNNAIVNLDTAIPLLKKKLNKDSVTIVFPDASAQERFLPLFQEFRSICFSRFDFRIIQKNNWPIIGYDTKCLDNVLVVDDSVQTGDTFLECLKVLKSLGAKNISLYATHAVFRNSSYNKFLFDEEILNDINKFYVTNTIPEITSKLEGHEPFEIIKIDNLIRENLLELFDLPKEEQINPRQYNIYVSSENNVKLGASYDAITNILKESKKENFKVNVFGVNVPSEVSEQPVNEETYIGCKNRFDNLKKYVDKRNLEYDVLVSIENGMYYEGQLYDNDVARDYCQVIIMTKTNDSISKGEKLSEKYTIFPVEFLIESIKQDKKITVGKLIEHCYGYKEGTWHEHFGDKISRKEIIRETVESLFSETCGDLLDN